MSVPTFRSGALALLLSLAASGCASLPDDWGRADAARLAAERGRALPQTADAAAYTREQLAQPLTPQATVALALLNNPDLRARNAQLGIAAADLYEASRMANPVISATRLSGDSGPRSQLTLGIGFDVLGLLTLPANRRNAQAGVEAAKLEAGSAIVELATQAERAWFEAAAAQQRAEVRELAARAASASGEIAQRYFDAGNINRRQLALEQAEAGSLRLESLATQAQAATERAALNRIMGQREDSAWTLATPLPEPAAQEPSLAALLREAVGSRLDIAAAQQQARGIAGRYRLVRRTRLIGDIELGAEREREYDGAINAGPSASLRLPLFDWGSGRKARAQAELDIAEARLDGLVLDASNDVRAAYARMQVASERVRTYRDVVIPQRETVVEFLQREVNYMLAGVFELLVAKRQEYDAYSGYIDAVRDYWIARADLTQAVGHTLPIDAATQDPHEGHHGHHDTNSNGDAP